MRRYLKGDKELLGTTAPGWQEFPRQWYQQARSGEFKGCLGMGRGGAEWLGLCVLSQCQRQKLGPLI